MPTSMANVTVHESCQDGQGYLGQLTKVAHPTFLAPLPIRLRIQGPRTGCPATRASPPILRHPFSVPTAATIRPHRVLYSQLQKLLESHGKF